VEIVVPPLRKREEDIVLRARHFDKIYTNKYMKPLHDFDSKARKAEILSLSGEWRELQYTIERAVIMAEGDCCRQGPDLLTYRVGAGASGRATGAKA